MSRDVIHSLLPYLRRFRFEWLGFWAVSAALSWALATDQEGAALYRLKTFELVLLTVVVARLALSETVFKTTGGWRSRPLTRNAVGWARFWTLVILLGLPLLLRLAVWWKMVPMVGARRMEVLRDDATGLGLFIGGAFLFSYLVSKLIERERRGLALFFVLPLAVGGALMWLWSGISSRPGIMSGGSLRGYGMTLGMRAAFPEGTTFIGTGRDQASDARMVREIMRIPLRAGGSQSKDGFTVTIRSISVSDRLTVDLTEYVPDKAFDDDFRNRAYAVRYGDNSVAGEVDGGIYLQGLKALFYFSEKNTRSSVFRSSRDYPWNEWGWDRLLDGAELVLFQVTDERLRPQEEKFEIGEKLTIGDALVRNALRALHPKDQEFNVRMVDEISASREDVVALLLKWPVWSDDAFNKLVLPILGKRAEERHRVALEERFLSDPRLAGFLMEKGWGDSVMPELIRRLKGNYPLDSQELVMVAGLKDAPLADALVAAFFRLRGKNEAVAAALKDHPGVEWPAVVREGWEQEKTGYPVFTQWWTFANWAAREGDVSALRQLAVEAANGKKWEREQLTEIVDSGGEDPVRWLARNHERMRYDPVMKRYTATR